MALSSLVSIAVSPFGQCRGEPKPVHRSRVMRHGGWKVTGTSVKFGRVFYGRSVDAVMPLIQRL